MCGTDCLLAFIAVIFPPLPVWVKRGICSADSLINIALLVLGFVPGLLHSWYIIFSSPDPTYEQLAQQDPERGHATTHTYYVVPGQPQYAPASSSQRPAGNYGTAGSAPNVQFPPSKNGFVQPPAAASSAAPNASSSSEAAPPPSYQQATEADNKIQRS